MSDLQKEHPQTSEVRRLLAHLTANGFTLRSVDDGEDSPALVTSVDQALEVICGVDESSLSVMHPDWVKPALIYIVLGNGPGELASDYTDRQPLTKCIDDWSDSEQNAAEQKQAVTDEPAKLFAEIPLAPLGSDLANQLADAASNESGNEHGYGAANANYSAAIAKRGLVASLESAENDPEAGMKDFVANLMHLADKIGVDFESVLESARNSYHAETEGVGTGDVADDLPSENSAGKPKTR
jgi:hypothetical protein